jgi:hypothetical protein
MSGRRFKLTRREVLIGFGTVGAVSAGAGTETGAHADDRRTSTRDTTRLEELELVPTPAIRAGRGPDVEVAFGPGAAGRAPIEITDAVPGDVYRFRWRITVEEAPGYVAVAGRTTDRSGHDAGDVTPDGPWNLDRARGASTLGSEADATLAAITFGEGGERAERYEASYHDLASLLDDLAGGRPVSDDAGDAIRVAAGETVAVELTIEIPADVGNEIQGAGIRLDLRFSARQARHADPDSVRDAAVVVE